MKAIVVLTFELPDQIGPEGAGEAIADVMTKLDPPSLPYFAGAARVAVDPVATTVEKWLDE